MMKAFSSRHYKCLFIGANLALLLTLILSACNGAGSNTTSNSRSTKSVGSGNSSTTTTTGSAPQLKLGTRPCPEAVKDPSYWDPIVGTQANVSKVESVSCANLEGSSSLQALITLRYYGNGPVPGVNCCNNITDPSPPQTFTFRKS